MRFALYEPSTDADLNRNALAPHRDASTLTLLFNRISGLQILTAAEAGKPDESRTWAYALPRKGHAIVNMGDAMVAFSNGLLRSAPHRVVAPAGAERGMKRFSLMYFLRPGDESLVKKLEGGNVPVQDMGQEREFGVGKTGYCGKDWVAWKIGVLGKGDEKVGEVGRYVVTKV